jgi:type II secretory pathway component PulC
MSYILDAIKKAEKQRLQEQTPTLESVVSQQPDRSSRWGTGRIILFILIIATAVAAGWYYEPVREQVSERAAPLVSWGQGQYSRLVTGSEDESESVSKPVAEEQAVQEPASDLAEPKITPSQREVLESIELAVISYSKDANKRFVMDGSKILREGDSLQGFPIKAIEKNSVVVEVDGQDYRISF